MSASRQIVRVREWIDSRVPAPPPALAEKIAEVVGEDSCLADDLSAILVGKAKAIIRAVGNDRAHALDLLTADALITYGMEAAVEFDPDPSVSAAKAMKSLGSTA